MMDGDGNLAALKQREEGVAKAEEIEEAFSQEVSDVGIMEEYEELDGRVRQIAAKYDLEVDLDVFRKRYV